MRVRDPLRSAHDPIAGRLGDEARRSGAGVPVVIHEMMERALGDRRTPVGAGLEGDRDVETPPGRLAGAEGNYPRGLIRRRADPTFMWV